MNTTLTRLRWASLAEGVTLLLLVGVAVPLKRLAGFPEAVSVLGPIHGGAFLLYVAMVLHARQKGLWSATETFQLLLASVVPLGAFFVSGLFRRKQAALARG
jgi:integral membrane protein